MDERDTAVSCQSLKAAWEIDPKMQFNSWQSYVSGCTHVTYKLQLNALLKFKLPPLYTAKFAIAIIEMDNIYWDIWVHHASALWWTEGKG